MPYRHLNDETLVMLTLAGEQNAYEVLVTRYQKAVIASAFSVTHNAFMAEDTAQDAFVTAWMKLDRLNEPQKFASWVCRIAKNCGLNMVRRYRGFVSLDDVENYDIIGEDSPLVLYEKNEEKTELYTSISRLPERVKSIIQLHYFEGLSIAEIADRLRVTQGTVKSQLHDGRKKIRKELCAMNEKWNDTLIEKVMKKVEELKLWQFKNNKDGFAEVYKDVLRDVEELPESGKKYHALADVLMHGWWWLPGDKNDALFAKIKEAAELGHNEDVMEFIVTREEQQIPYSDTNGRIEFIRDKQIPQLEKAGFTKALARQWYWLGYYYFKDNKFSEGAETMEKVKSLLTPADLYYALALNTMWKEEKAAGEFKDKDEDNFNLSCDAYELRYMGATPRYWKDAGTCKGYIQSINRDILGIFRTASFCDGYFYNPELKVGESMVGSDGTTLTFAAAGEKVETPAGVFEGCELWVTKDYKEYRGHSTYKVCYKDGVGIVKYSCTNYGLTETRLLAKYSIVGGEGLLPMHEGNEWQYADEYNPEYLRSDLTCRVTHADGKSAIIATTDVTERFGYDENSWVDMIQQIRNEYCKENIICDVSLAVERAEALAKTPIEKAHTKAAASVVRRIMATDSTFSPERTADGLWNFFKPHIVHKNGGNINITYNSRWSFEYKNYVEGCDGVLCNHIYSILRDAGKYLWSDEWKIGADTIVEYTQYNNPLKINISCTDGGTVATKAGTFENCLKISFDVKGMDSGRNYRGGNKEYYFAEGIGIVKAVNELQNLKKATYELVSYTGTGEGYMPIADGLVRKYEAVDLTDGFYSSAEYTYAANEDGDIYIFADKCGIRNKLPEITMYNSIQDEVIEDELWAAGKREESRLRHDVNNFKLLLHFLCRTHRNRAKPQKAVAWGNEQIRIVEQLGAGGEVPRAWLGFRLWQNFVTAPAYFGCGEKEKGYEYLEKSFELYHEWAKIPDGELLEVGDEMIYGGIKLVKGKEIIELPDGTREGIEYGQRLNFKAENMYYGMTAKRGWEWFNSVREEERFKAYIERAKALMEAEKKK